MIRFLAVTIAMLGFFAVPTSADEAQCYQSDQYLVIAQQRVDEVGTDFIIRSPAQGKIACLYEIQDTDVVLSNPGDPLHYEQLIGQYLVLTRSTGPQGDLVIYDLTRELWSPLLDVRAGDDISIAGETVTYWQQLILGTETNCSSYEENAANDLGSMIFEERILDLATVTVGATGKTRCDSTQ